MGEYDGTVTSRLKPIVTMLTEALVNDFSKAYAYQQESDSFIRTDEDGIAQEVSENIVIADVRDWIHGIDVPEWEGEFNRMVLAMVRKNPGWEIILANRVIKWLKKNRAV